MVSEALRLQQNITLDFTGIKVSDRDLLIEFLRSKLEEFEYNVDKYSLLELNLIRGYWLFLSCLPNTVENRNLLKLSECSNIESLIEFLDNEIENELENFLGSGFKLFRFLS